MRHIHTREHHSALKRMEILPFITTRMDRDDITVRERSQSHKNKYCMMSMYMRSLGQLNPQGQKWDDSGWGGGRGKLVFDGHSSVGKMKSPGTDGGTAAQQCESTHRRRAPHVNVVTVVNSVTCFYS